MDLKDYAVIIGTLILFVSIINSSYTGLIKFVLTAVILIISGHYFKEKYNLETEMGFILLKSRKGRSFFSRISRWKGWEFIGDLGFGVVMGLLVIKFLKWKPLKYRIVIFIISAILISMILFLYPFSISFLTESMGAMSKEVKAPPAHLLIIPYATGLMGTAYISIISSALHTTIKLIDYFVNGGEKVNQGATLILPGINIPLVEGILALAVVLIVHEGSHAVQMALAKIPLKSSGLVLFGILPVGAFVEPDEKRLSASSPKNKVRIASGGPFANIVLGILFGLVFMLFLNLTSDYSVDGCMVLSGVLQKGTVIYSINEEACCNLTFKPNETLHLKTNKGDITVKTDENGKIGILCMNVGKEYLARYYENNFLNFMYSFIGLCFALNAVVGLINLLPIALFDGSMIVKAVFGDSIITKLLVYSTTLSFIILLLPALI